MVGGVDDDDARLDEASSVAGPSRMLSRDMDMTITAGRDGLFDTMRDHGREEVEEE